MSIAIITGGSRGIGASAAIQCAKRGMGVILTYNSSLDAVAIRANSIAPGPIRTDLGGGMSQEFETLLAGQTALGRVGEPDDVDRWTPVGRSSLGERPEYRGRRRIHDLRDAICSITSS